MTSSTLIRPYLWTVLSQDIASLTLLGCLLRLSKEVKVVDILPREDNLNAYISKLL